MLAIQAIHRKTHENIYTVNGTENKRQIIIYFFKRALLTETQRHLLY